jgi:hypothetical protein
MSVFELDRKGEEEEMREEMKKEETNLYAK